METNVSVERATELILQRAEPLQVEQVKLADALGRVLRADAVADADSPRFDCSAVDGYAMRRADVEQLLRVAAEIQPGEDETREVRPGECMRIFTGARVPSSANYIAMQEDVERRDDSVRVVSLADDDNIRRRGENVHKGDVVVRAGTQLRPSELAALASFGLANPTVTRRPRMVHFVTGNELVDPGETPVGSQLRDSNSTLVAAFCRAHGAELCQHQRLPDSFEAAKKAIDSLGSFDVLLISGGASVGDYDYAQAMLKHGGFECVFQNVNLRPGKPLGFFAREGALAFALPGNPVSHWVILHLFIAPLLDGFSGESMRRSEFTGYLAKDFTIKPNRRETHLPSVATFTDGGYRLDPQAFVSSGDMASVVGANALMKIPTNSGGFSRRDPVIFRLCEL